MAVTFSLSDFDTTIHGGERGRALRVPVVSPRRAERMHELRLHEVAMTSVRRTLPSVTVRKVSINSSHFSIPSLSLISSSHDMASSTIA